MFLRLGPSADLSDDISSQTDSDQTAKFHASQTSNTPTYITQVHEWIRACNKLHGNVCIPESIPQRAPEDVPLWLIDTHQQCIVPGHSAHRYLALSYVWPVSRDSSDLKSSRHSSDFIAAPPRTLLLDDTSVLDFQRPGFLGTKQALQLIPMVIQHAIGLVSAIGERYLWVDRLCIVQSDLRDGGTKSQIAKMDKIYAGAHLTIIAAAPDRMYDLGLDSDWPSLKSAKDQVFSRSLQQEEIRGALDVPSEPEKPMKEEISGLVSARYMLLSSSKWATRGWTYQEQILCRRALIFIESGLFWDCQCCLWDGVDLHPTQELSNLPLRADLGQRFAQWWPDFSFYLDLICSYNGREFSYPQDALLGISGILNALGESFPGGFICGLPRLFLDHALLWQPFGIAMRRIDRNEDGSVLSSLPSWSWCGWQGHVDPWSLRSGLSYVYKEDFRDRARSWRTRNLLEWSFSVKDQTPQPVLEPQILDGCVDITSTTDIKAPDGWLYHEAASSSSKAKIFTHEKDQRSFFTHPIPLKASVSVQNYLTPAYLTCSTTTVSLFPATVLDCHGSQTSTTTDPSKASIFEDKIFKAGPLMANACPILVLQQANGGFAGLLRLMDKAKLDEATPIELIAISTGSTYARDLCGSLEWKIFETTEDRYSEVDYSHALGYSPRWISGKGRYALLFDGPMAFDKDLARMEHLGLEFEAALEEIQQRVGEPFTETAVKYPELAITDMWYSAVWLKARNNFLQKQDQDMRREDFDSRRGVERDQPSSQWNMLKRRVRDRASFEPSRDASMQASWRRHPRDQPGLLCEFYNVLWIERRDGLAYRRACGWVPKHVWEAHATGPVDVTLG